MKLPRLSLQNLMLPLLILAFVGLAVTFLASVFTVQSRWFILIVIAAYLLVRREMFHPLRTGFAKLVMLFGVWCLCTTAWSEIPELSAMKATAFLVTSMTALAAGTFWVRTHPQEDALAYLLPLTFVALAAGVLGRFTTTGVVHLSEDVTLYQGAVTGANMFGSMLAMCTPLLIWKVYESGSDTRRRAFWLALLGACIFYLLAAKSRSAFLAVLCTLLAFFIGFRSRKKFLILVSTALVALLLALVVPWMMETIARDYVYKHTTEEGLLYSRSEAWEESYDLAIRGGVLGGGYGVTIGDDSFQGGFTAVGYGREKANSQLAIVEETGLVGLGLYAILLATLFQTLLRGIRSQPVYTHRLQLWLVTGMLAGMTVLSVFEAWWVAPSSPESVYFWTLAGVAMGLATRRAPVSRSARITPLGSLSTQLPVSATRGRGQGS